MITKNEPFHGLNHVRAQIICDTAHLAANGFIDAELVSEVTSWYEASEVDFVVIRAFNECVTNKDVERSSHRI